MLDNFQNLYINSNLIKDGNLLNLKKVNVICGRNNSGKTTLLKTLQNKKQISEGKIFGDNEFNRLGLNSQNLEELKKETWYHPDQNKFYNMLSKKYDLAHFNPSFHTNFRENWERIFTNSYSITYIPPKRELELVKQINFAQIPETNGKGLLNALFLAKTQPPESYKNNFYLELKEKFEEISTDCTFDVFSQVNKQDNQQHSEIKLKFSYIGSNSWIDAENSGLGLQDLLVLLYFSLTSYGILLVEEPENHIHPEMQRKLLRFWSEQAKNQLFIATHSNIFLNRTYVERIFFTSFINGKIIIDDKTKRADVLTQLGFSIADNLISDLIILVEGPTDIPVIEEFLKKFGVDAKYNIKTLPLGGDIMNQIDISAFAEKYNVIALIDKDPKSDKIRKQFENKCKELKIPITRLERYAIENYFSIDALREVFKGQIPAKLTSIDPDISLEDQIKINVKNNNRKLAQAMIIEDIKGTDLYKFFEKVKEICERE